LAWNCTYIISYNTHYSFHTNPFFGYSPI